MKQSVVHHLWPLLCNIPELKDLSLLNYELGDGMVKLLESLPTYTGLSSLNLMDNDIESEYVPDLMPALAPPMQLQSLDVGGNEFVVVDGFLELAAGFSSVRALGRLSLADSNLEEHDIYHIAIEVRDLSMLECLNLNQCGLDEDAARAWSPIAKCIHSTNSSHEWQSFGRWCTFSVLLAKENAIVAAVGP